MLIGKPRELCNLISRSEGFSPRVREIKFHNSRGEAINVFVLVFQGNSFLRYITHHNQYAVFLKIFFFLSCSIDEKIFFRICSLFQIFFHNNFLFSFSATVFFCSPFFSFEKTNRKYKRR